MRHLITLLAWGFVVGGCSSPQAAKSPEAAAPPVMAAPAPKPSEPARPAVPVPPPPPPKPAESVVDRKPIALDLKGFRLTQGPSELFGYDDNEGRVFLYTNGTVEWTARVPPAGTYDLLLTASCNAALNENAKFILRVDGAQVGPETTCKSEDAKEYRFEAALSAGERKISVEFTNDVYKEGEYDRNLYVNGLKLVRAK